MTLKELQSPEAIQRKNKVDNHRDYNKHVKSPKR